MTDEVVVRYALVGLLNTAVGYVLILGLQFGAGLPATMANLGGFCVGWLLSFVLNRRLAFRHDRAIGSSLVLFALGAGLCWCLNAAFLHLALRVVPSPLAQALALATYTVSFYFWNRHVVFPGRK